MAEVATTPYEILTPEGVTLTFEVATVGDRISAFLIDITLIVLVLIILIIAQCSVAESSSVASAFLTVATFLTWNFYFIYSELRGSGTTIGKRKLGLRVIARDGGPLTADMIFARNFIRNLELLVPLAVLGNMAENGWLGAAGAAWAFVFMLFPLFGSYRLRCGDLIAGTIVVREPHTTLLPDLAADQHSSTPQPTRAKSQYDFTPQHLRHYGIKELQVLEEIFHKHEKGEAPTELLVAVAERVMKRIGWPREPWGIRALPFLRSFYQAQRAHLERKLLFGERKEQKSGSAPEPPPRS